MAAQTTVHETDAAFLRSQEMRAEAIKAFRAGNLDTALEAMLQALKERPTNTALLSNAIFLAAETNDIDTAHALTLRFTKLGVNPGGAIQEKLKEKLTTQNWETLNKKFIENAARTGVTTEVVSIPTHHKLVEGIAADGSGNMFFSTVVSGELLKADTTGNISVLFDGTKDDLGSFFGIAYDKTSQALFATFASIAQTPAQHSENKDTGVVKIDPLSGKLLKKWTLPGGSEGQQVADITITNTGSVFVADAAGSKIYNIEGDTLQAIPTTAQFMNPQGIIALNDTEILMADYGRGLWKVNANTGAATLYGVPDNATLIGIDGLFSHEGKIIAIQNGTSPQRMIEIQLNNDSDTVSSVTTLAQSLPVFDEPTLGMSTLNGIMFVASSQWPKFDKGGVLREGATLADTIILRLQ
ncbi:NHL repeat-containing protein [Kordiimonas aquimaris]|uniref:hypothetical protein n=1 Tax=Kordiimonas aquimaris TaxID=707591 RepID=UPI0021D3E321|nr:hypothetical protein [Kordiimonas aquimaris]